MRSYEEICSVLAALDSPIDPDRFHIDWLDSQSVAIGKSRNGGHSIFVMDAHVEPSLPGVIAAMRKGSWQTTTGETISGSILELPPGEPFSTATAAIAAELFRRGIAERPPALVFSEVEPFIALILRRILLPSDYVIGLIGELIVLQQLLVALRASAKVLDDPTSLWRGWRPQNRDFVLGRAAIEVKTTSLPVSRHHIANLDQVEARVIEDGATESLHLASIGLRRSAGGGPYSVSGLTDQILSLLADDASSEAGDTEIKFLDRLSQYGPEEFVGYRHQEMKAFDVYRQTFGTTFAPRFYNMNDANIRIIRRSDLAEHFSFVLPEGLQYAIDFPSSVPGSINNPRIDLATLLLQLIAQSGL